MPTGTQQTWNSQIDEENWSRLLGIARKEREVSVVRALWAETVLLKQIFDDAFSSIWF